MVLSNYEDAFQIQRDMLLLSGMWPVKNPSMFYQFKTIFSWVMIIVQCIMMWMQVFKVMKDFAELSQILYIMITVTVAIIKLGFFAYHKKYFWELLQLLKTPIFASYSEEFDHYMASTIKYSRLIANIYRGMVLFYVVFIGFYPLVENKSLPFPFDYNIEGYIIPMYGFQLVSEVTSAWNNSTLDSLCFSLMGISSAQLDILCKKIIKLKGAMQVENQDNQSEAVASRQFELCLEHYLAIIRYTDLIQKIFTVSFLTQFLASVIVMCNTAFYFILISTLSFQFVMLADYLVLIILELFVYCWYGNEIILKSLLIRDACYFSKWYIYGNKFRKSIFITMERSKKPICITAWKFSNLSLASFSALMQWSYSCLALLLKMYYKKEVN